MKSHRRIVRPHTTPEVKADCYKREVRVTCEEWRNETKFLVDAQITTWCAINLIRNLRRALREIGAHDIAVGTKLLEDEGKP